MVVGAFVGAAVTGAFVILEKGKHVRLNLRLVLFKIYLIPSPNTYDLKFNWESFCHV